MSTQTISTDTDLERRAAYTSGLRALADFIDEHPELPIPQPSLRRIEYCVSGSDDTAGVARVAEIAAVLGVDVTYESSHPGAVRQFGEATYRAYYVPREEMRRHYAYSSYSGAVQPDDEKAVA